MNSWPPDPASCGRTPLSRPGRQAGRPSRTAWCATSTRRSPKTSPYRRPPRAQRADRSAELERPVGQEGGGDADEVVGGEALEQGRLPAVAPGPTAVGEDAGHDGERGRAVALVHDRVGLDRHRALVLTDITPLGEGVDLGLG